MCLAHCDGYRRCAFTRRALPEVLGEKGRRIRELTAVVQKRFGFPENSVELFAERVENRAMSAMAQCESLRYGTASINWGR